MSSRTTVILIGGGIGATLRYLLGLWLAPPTPPDFPWVTFAVNMLGTFGIGMAMTALATGLLRPALAKPLIVTGLLGGFTTWSHFIVETDRLIGDGQAGLASIYVVVSIAGGVAVAALGALIVESIRRRRPSVGSA